MTIYTVYFTASMKTILKINRYLLIPAMIPVMWIMWKLVLSADRLHAWKYSENIAPPTQSDYSFAALAFFTALLTPLLVGLIAAMIAYYKKYQSCWPVLETVFVVSVYLIFIIAATYPGVLSKVFDFTDAAVIGASCLVGGVIVIVLTNTAACVRQRNWGKFTNSVLVFLGGMLYLFWLYSFVIYIDT